MIAVHMSIAKRIISCFAILIAIVIAGSLINYWKLAFIDQTIKWSSHTYDVLNENTVLIGSMIDRETGLRGYLLAGDRKFLAPYEGGAQAFAAAAQRLRGLTADNPAQLARLDRIEALARRWQTEVAEPEIAPVLTRLLVN